MKVFVHLAHGTDAATWRARLADGRVLGVNEDSPYGYALARDAGCTVEFSRDAPESRPLRVLRLGLRRLLGFDAIHVARNRRAIAAADVVWTHTECQTLAVLLLLKMHRRGAARPRLIGQSIWLFDAWPGLSRPRRALYRWLLGNADVLTVHSPMNLAIVRAALPTVRSELVRFGIGSAAPLPARIPRTVGAPIQLLSVGNDRDRDWPTLIAAVARDARFALTIVSTTIPRALLAAAPRTRVVHPEDNAALYALYAQADLAVVPLKPNRHASGATAVQEAVLLGVPVVCSGTGGLDAYFDAREVRYVDAGDPADLGRALAEFAERPQALAEFAANARRRFASDHGAARFVARHVELSRELLGPPRSDRRRSAEDGPGSSVTKRKL
ncbi:MAG: glycosyltransferase [Burkholderiaceae bacterium]